VVNTLFAGDSLGLSSLSSDTEKIGALLQLIVKQKEEEEKVEWVYCKGKSVFFLIYFFLDLPKEIELCSFYFYCST
jgi:hypothetical protein